MTEQSDFEPDEGLLVRTQEVFSGVQNGRVRGIVCICFMDNETINVQVAGAQSLIVRLGSLTVAMDALKMLESQQQAQRQAQRAWGPGGNA